MLKFVFVYYGKKSILTWCDVSEPKAELEKQMNKKIFLE